MRYEGKAYVLFRLYFLIRRVFISKKFLLPNFHQVENAFDDVHNKCDYDIPYA